MEDLVNYRELRLKLFEVMKNNPMSQREYSKKLGISPITLKAFMVGKNEPEFTTLLRVAKLLDDIEK